MNNVKYPTQVSQAMVRSNALLTIVFGTAALVTGMWWIPAFMAADFAIRGFLNPRNSVFSSLSGLLVPYLPFSQKLIYFPPKQFAARVGFVFSIAIALLMVTGAQTAAIVVGSVLITFASLEAFANICAGCMVYNALLLIGRRLRSA